MSKTFEWMSNEANQVTTGKLVYPRQGNCLPIQLWNDAFNICNLIRIWFIEMSQTNFGEISPLRHEACLYELNLPALQAVWGLEKKNISVFWLKVSLIEKVNPFGYKAYSKKLRNIFHHKWLLFKSHVISINWNSFNQTFCLIYDKYISFTISPT